MTVPPLPQPAAVEVIQVALPLVRPHRTAHGVEDVRRSVLVRATLADGTSGWGECPALATPGYSSETSDAAFEHLRDVAVPSVLRGSSWRSADHPMAGSAVEGALVDAVLRRDGLRLTEVLGPGDDSVETCAVVSASSIDDLLAIVAVRVAEGHRALSVKVHPGWASEPLTAVSDAWPELVLSADANGSFDVGSDELGRLDGLGLAYLEQPLPAGDLHSIVELAGRWDTPIALDESIDGVAAVERVASLGGNVIVNVKPSRLGGLGETSAVLAAVAENGQEAFCGGMLETGVGRAHALAVAVLDACTHATHLGPSGNYFMTDVTDPFLLIDGARLGAPRGAGIGVDPRPAVLAEFTIETVELMA